MGESAADPVGQYPIVTSVRGGAENK
jgi:hypothetical protein